MKKNLEIFKPLYEIVNSFLSNGYAVIYGVESLQKNDKDKKDYIFNQILKSNKIHNVFKKRDFDNKYDKYDTLIEDS